MHPMAARALLAMQLSRGQKENLRSFERTLQPGRYLSGAEICGRFKIKPLPATEEDTGILESLYRDYEKRIQWKVNELEQKNHDAFCRKTNREDWCKCRTRQEEVHEWEDWAADNFGKALEDIKWEIPTKMLTRI